MNRRALLKNLLGGGAMAATMSPQQAADALGMPSALHPGTAMEPAASVPSPPQGSKWFLRRMMFAREEAASRPDEHLPVHIRSKKSWSPAFKAACFEREKIIMEMIMDRADEDDAFADKVAAALGLGGHG